MPDRTFRLVLAAAMAAALALFFIDPQPRGNPADEAALAKIVDSALDSDSPRRLELWHAAHEQIALLDPNRPTAASTFVRSGLFHWYELGDADRRSVIAAIEPLLRDPTFFDKMARPLFQLTGDFTILRRANPGTEGAMSNRRPPPPAKRKPLRGTRAPGQSSGGTPSFSFAAGSRSIRSVS